jgi:hypothetical protein
VVAIALRTIGSAAHFFLTRHREQAWVGPYVVTTVEVRPNAYETHVTWGEGGPQVEHFGSALAFDPVAAAEAHEEVCVRIEHETGLERLSKASPPAPAA